MSRRRAPRRLGESLPEAITRAAPATLLAEVQAAWPAVCGEAIAANAEPVAERDGTVTIACAAGAWAEELDLISPTLLERLAAEIGPDRVRALRFTADLSRHR